MPVLDLERLKQHRTRTYHTAANTRLTGPAEALDFVNERGFVYLWPIHGVEMPSLWVAAAGDRPVADQHDDPGHVTWRWKDDSLAKKIWYYAKILRGKATFISLEMAPYFYALSENYGSPEEDYLLAYQAGTLTLAAKQVYEALLEKGCLDTLSLRKEARLQNAKEAVFNRALQDLQMDLKILPVGVAEVGAWRYAFRYEITARHMLELVVQAGSIGEAQARQELVLAYLVSVGAVTIREVGKLFGWKPELVQRTVVKLVRDGELVETAHPQQPGTWLALPAMAAP